MSIFGKFFGTERTINAGISAIDAMVYTDEEKVKDKKEFLKLYEPYKRGQRMLAAMFAPAYITCWLAVFFIELVKLIKSENQDTADILQLLNGDMGSIVLMIIIFYFGGGAVEGVVNRLKK
jgi:hypothetical protein